jgi:cytochrome b subunit of formate dehydrogenase
MVGANTSTVRIRKGVFWALFVLGSVLLIFGILLAQVPSKNHAHGTLVFSIAALFLMTSLVLGMFRGVGHWFLTIVVSGEVLVCIYGLWSLLT